MMFDALSLPGYRLALEFRQSSGLRAGPCAGNPSLSFTDVTLENTLVQAKRQPPHLFVNMEQSKPEKAQIESDATPVTSNPENSNGLDDETTEEAGDATAEDAGSADGKGKKSKKGKLRKALGKNDDEANMEGKLPWHLEIRLRVER